MDEQIKYFVDWLKKNGIYTVFKQAYNHPESVRYRSDVFASHKSDIRFVIDSSINWSACYSLLFGTKYDGWGYVNTDWFNNHNVPRSPFDLKEFDRIFSQSKNKRIVEFARRNYV